MLRTINCIIYIVFCVTSFFSNSCSGQNQILAEQNSRKCSAFIKQISDKWKADSLAGNGYRLEVYKNLLECTLDSFNENFLLDNLGSPTEKIYYTGGGRAYYYNYYDYKYIDLEKSKRKGFGWDFLIFVVDSASEKVVRIKKGSGEY